MRGHGGDLLKCGWSVYYGVLYLLIMKASAMMKGDVSAPHVVLSFSRQSGILRGTAYLPTKILNNVENAFLGSCGITLIIIFCVLCPQTLVKC